MNSFESLYNGLNLQQKQAVDQLEGPVMVIAGPGTGKTQILATRILNILRTDTLPENILCLTYTEAGATAMLQRLSLFMGSDAYKVNIHTFHGLCNQIIKDYPHKFNRREMRVMDEIERIELIQEIIAKIDENSPLKTYNDDPTALQRQLSQVWSIMESEGYNVANFEEWIQYLNDDELFKMQFPELVYKRKYKEFQAGDINETKRKNLNDNWKKLLDAAKLHEQYVSLKKEKGIYEFSDMLNWVNDLLKKDEELKLMVQEKYHYVLVDEYQDTSGVQNDILFSLIDFWEDNPNCFVVGDDDQSIYAFQGAKVSNMLTFKKRYEENILTIVLTQNYRSTQIILDASGKLIEHNKSRLVNNIEGLSKDLVSSGNNQAYEPIPVNANLYLNEFHEAIGIVDDIKNKLSQGIKSEEIALLYSKHKHADLLVDVLRENQIPFILNRSINILNESMVRQLIDWLTYLSQESNLANSGEFMLYRLLLSDFYAIPTFALNQISTEIYQIKRQRELQNQTYSWREHLNSLLSNQDSHLKYGAEALNTIKELWLNIEKWIKIAVTESVPTLIQRIYSEGGFLAHALKKEDNGWAMEVLHSFMEFSTQQNARIPFMKLRDFLLLLQKMESNNLSIPLEKRIGNSEGIQLMTAHGSKGLEFDHVYVIQTNPDNWEKDKRNSYPFSLRELTLGNKQIISSEISSIDAFEERRRLFYVAMTRAKKSLTISLSKTKIKSKPEEILASTFVLEVMGDQKLPERPIEIGLEKLQWAQQKYLEKVNQPVLEVDKIDWLKSKIANLTFSPTSIEMMMRCGIEFYFSRILRVPSAPNQYGAYGTAIHATMREFVVKGVNQQKWMTDQELIKHFEYEMLKLRAGFTEKQFELKLDQGRTFLPKFRNQKLSTYQEYSKIETEFSVFTKIADVSITGNIDKLVFAGNQATIYDYKTSKIASSKNKSKAPSKSTIENGKFPPSYWFQLGLYTMMLTEANQQKGWKSRHGVIESMEMDNNGVFPDFEIIFSNEDYEYITSIVETANEKLQNLSFLEGCGTCEWCKFAKQVNQVIYVPQNTDDSESDLGNEEIVE